MSGFPEPSPPPQPISEFVRYPELSVVLALGCLLIVLLLVYLVYIIVRRRLGLHVWPFERPESDELESMVASNRRARRHRGSASSLHCHFCLTAIDAEAAQETANANGRIECPVCSATLDVASLMQQRRAPGNPIPCPSCAMTFGNQEELFSHFESSHASSTDDEMMALAIAMSQSSANDDVAIDMPMNGTRIQPNPVLSPMPPPAPVWSVLNSAKYPLPKLYFHTGPRPEQPVASQSDNPYFDQSSISKS
eukprot:TRINITY_DN18540_c0_g1_i1.p1 TRINITY_DN18540_c0_g1~~TRINITY_DN18540_c0_g1_i1.p1  ORF type:complete len:251 (-),score=54.83 TRINITY_DN18540_c0_g1_i1:138-890(-)